MFLCLGFIFLHTFQWPIAYTNFVMNLHFLSFTVTLPEIPWRREWQTIPVFLTAESHGQRRLVFCIPWSWIELDMTKWLTHPGQVDLEVWQYPASDSGFWRVSALSIYTPTLLSSKCGGFIFLNWTNCFTSSCLKRSASLISF